MGREYLCWVDGSCKPGEGAPGGWGFHVRPPNGPPVEGYGKARSTHAKVMEYRAVAEALAVLPERSRALVFSDNQPLVETMTRKLDVWRANRFANVDPLVVDLVRRVAELIEERQLVVRWQWVRAHNGNAGNERADELAARGAREARDARDGDEAPPRGPRPR